MDQNQSIDNDLQKAIDNITNTTNVDPVFSDPVAAPSSVPEGDTGELGEPVGPFPEPKLEVIPPAPEPIAPLEAMSTMPNLTMLQTTPPTTSEPTPVAPEPAPVAPTTPNPSTEASAHNLNTAEIKKAALRDLVPLLSKVNLAPEQKFNLYRNIFEDLKDYSVLEPAYHVAHEIPDETARAEALLYLVEAIDKM